jgi:uncharacterized protein involved in exopolysaccharide biosynthesis
LRTINVENAAQLVTLGIEWKDPVVAAEWTNSLVTMLNEHTRQKRISESRNSIQFLQAEIENTNVVSVRTALYGILERELRSSMVANVRREYALQVIDPAVAANRPYRPKPLLNLFLAALAGFVLAILHLFLDVYLQKLAAAKAVTSRNDPRLQTES